MTAAARDVDGCWASNIDVRAPRHGVDEIVQQAHSTIGHGFPGLEVSSGAEGAGERSNDDSVDRPMPYCDVN